MNAICVTSLRQHYAHEVTGHSNEVDYKSMFYIVCRYIFDYLPTPNSANLITSLVRK